MHRVKEIAFPDRTTPFVENPFYDAQCSGHLESEYNIALGHPSTGMIVSFETTASLSVSIER